MKWAFEGVRGGLALFVFDASSQLSLYTISPVFQYLALIEANFNRKGGVI